MADITAAQVKELRERTGAGMMDCKSALVEAKGDMDEAVKVLRKKGLAAASKKAGRIASEGVVYAGVVGKKGVIVEVNCETDFVAKTPQFQELVKGIAEFIARSNATDVDTLLKEKWTGGGEGSDLAEMIAGKIATVGENISVRRFDRFDGTDKNVFGAYVHAGGKIGVLVELKASAKNSDPEVAAVAKDVAMHIAAAEPRFARRDEVTQKDLDTEREIARDSALKSGKPEAVVEKIVAGKMEKYYGENVLVEQAFVKDNTATVGQMMQKKAKDLGTTLEVARFTRYKLGEGLQKKSDDFAGEVMAQAGR